jgi:hypothetical protein
MELSKKHKNKIIKKKGIGYKNFWSLNTDEAVTIGILRGWLPKNVEVFIPANAQMKDIDLIIVNIENKKITTIQVKGSRAYEPKKTEIKEFGSGSAGWFHMNRDKIDKSSVDFFIFLSYVLEEDKKSGRRHINPHIVLISTNELKNLCKKYKKLDRNEMYNFFIWINPAKKQAIEFRDKKHHINMSKCLDKEGFEKLYAKLK